ncbi:MAG: hypothetical protein KDK70_12465 [Myxococcales bacterium]|nr:hypothetical protein [Myxococcales bacterium]
MDRLPSVADLVRQLRAFHGYRTLWIDEGGTEIVHAEPEEELEAEGYRYVATLLRPGPEALADALGRAGVPVGPVAAEASGGAWSAVEPLAPPLSV